MLIAKQLETFKKVYSIIKLCGIQRRNFMLREIANDFYMNQNYNCGECILRAANKAYDLGLDERGLKLASGFGAGMGCGNTCGALSAAMSVLSLLFCGDKAMRQRD